MLKMEITQAGVEIFLEDSIDSIFARQPQFDFLSVLLAEGRITAQDNILAIPHALIPDFSSRQLKILGLPEFCPHVFSCRSTGTVLRDNYAITPLFKTKTGKPLGRFELSGAFVTVAGKRYTAPRVVYKTCQLVDKINDVKQKDNKLENIKKLKEVIPFDIIAKRCFA